MSKGYRPTLEDDMSFTLLLGYLEDPNAQADEAHMRVILKELSHFMTDLGQEAAARGCLELANASLAWSFEVEWYKDKSAEVLKHLGLDDKDEEYDLDTILALDWVEIPEDVDGDKVKASIKRQQKKNQA